VHGVGGKVLGVVLNKVNLERNSYYYSQYYGEYYRNYYAEGVSTSRREDEAPRKTAPRPTARPSRRA
jgi:Mrp family chromosome partitioning ATPase